MNQTLCYTAKKILWTIPILVDIIFLAFGLELVARGDPAVNRVSADLNYIPAEEEIQELRVEMGLDDLILVQYGRWVWNATHGDPGESYIDDESVLDEILRLSPNTLLPSEMALLVITVMGPADGLLFTLLRDEFINLLGRILLVFPVSTPSFYLAYFMIWLFAQKLRTLPANDAEILSCFLMPCLAIPISLTCVVVRLLRSSTLREPNKNYILTVQAKGLRRNQLVSRHVLRNSLIPSITYIVNTSDGLLGGSMITESVFSVPGTGSYALTAINSRGYTAMQGYVLFTDVVFALTCLLADLIYVWLSSQIRLGG